MGNFCFFIEAKNILKGGPIGRNSIVKNSENFSERNTKNFVLKFFTVTEISLKKQKN